MIYVACLESDFQVVDGGFPYCENWHIQPVQQSGFGFSDIDPLEFKAGLSATLGIFAIGFIVGVVISLLKKAR